MTRSRIEKLICEQEQMHNLSRAEIERIQLKKLNSLLQRERERAGFYQHLPTGLKSLRDLQELPFTTAADLAQHAPSMLLCSQSRIQRVISDQTSGTSGVGKRVFYSLEDCENTIALYMAGLGELIYPGSKTMICMPFSGAYGLGELISAAITRLDASPIKVGIGKSYGELWAVILQEQPDTYVGMPVPLLSLLRMYGQGSLRRALVSGDSCPESVLRGIEERLGTKPFPHYGSREMGMAGAICCQAHEGMHIREHMLIAEIIDEKDQPLPHGSYGQLVFTAIGMDAMPLIRYKTGDYTRILPAICPCGSEILRIDAVERGNDPVSMGRLDQRFFSHPDLIDYRVTKKGGNYCFDILVGNGEKIFDDFYQSFGDKSVIQYRKVRESDKPFYMGKRVIL